MRITKYPDDTALRGEGPTERRICFVGLSGLILAVTVLIASASSASTLANRHKVSPSKTVLSAYRQTIGGKSAKISLSESIAATASGTATKQVSVSGTGSVDFANHNGSLTLSSPTTGTFTVRLISPLLYLQLPASERAQLPPGKSWVEINLNTVSEAKLGQSFSQLTSSSQESTQTLSYLQGVSKSGITAIGHDTIRGVATTEYKATVDLTKVANQKSPTEQAAIKNLEAELHTSMMPVQVWLDAQGRVRQITEQVQASTTPSSTPGSTIPATTENVSTTVDYYDFGVPVNVAAPPSSQVDDITGQALAQSTTTTTTGG
jgi:hypothetical protein